MNLTFNNNVLSLANDLLQGYDSTTDTNKNKRTEYVNWNATREAGAFEPTSKPGWLGRIFNADNTQEKIDRTRLEFLRAVVDEYLTAYDPNAETKEFLPNGVKNATIDELKAFVKSPVFPEDLRTALKIDDFGARVVRIPLSKFRVKEALTTLHGYVAPGTRRSVGEYTEGGGIREAGAPATGPKIFAEKMAPRIEEIKNLTVEDNGYTNEQKKLLVGIKKFSEMVTLFFGKNPKIFLFGGETIDKVLVGPYTPEALVTSDEAKQKEILDHWEKNGNVFCQLLVPAVKAALDDKSYDLSKALYATARPKRLNSVLTAFKDGSAEYYVADTFDKYLRYVLEENAKFEVSRATPGDILKSSETNDWGALVIYNRGHVRVGALYQKLQSQQELQEGQV